VVPLLAAAGAVAVADWICVWRRPCRAEVVLKPLVLVLLVAAALAADAGSGAQQAAFVVALVLSLAGDVLLLPQVDRFVPGLVAFLLAHVAYVVGFWLEPSGEGSQLWPIVVLAVLLGAAGPRILAGVRRDEPALAAPVVAYMAVIGWMVVTAGLSGDTVASLGACAFALSDTILALDRFDRRRRWAPVAVMTTYHLAQGLLVASL
jgi:uncharacterized membrane protein YhhN